MEFYKHITTELHKQNFMLNYQYVIYKMYSYRWLYLCWKSLCLGHEHR